MFSSLVMWLALAGSQGADPPTPAERRHEAFQWGAIEKMHRDQLEINKSRRSSLEEMIETTERGLKDPSLYTPAQADRLREQLVYWRERAQFMRKLQQEMEWWEQKRKLNPGPGTALEFVDRLEKITQEWDAWQAAWEAGRIAPSPREAKK